MSNTSSSSTGIGFWGLLQIVFITLKVTNLINWSWFWVLSPVWMSAIFIVCVIIFMVIMVIVANIK